MIEVIKSVGPTSSEWAKLLAAADHDFYHLPCYQELASQPGDVPRGIFIASAEDMVLLPYLRRQIPIELGEGDHLFEAYSAYGYPGPVASRGASTDFIKNALRAAMGELASQGYVTSFFRLHPLLNQPSQVDGLAEVVSHGPSVYINLSCSEAELWQQTRRGHKRDLVVLQKRGYSIVMNDWRRLDDFLKCYYESMRRVQASDFYFFPKEYFESLRRCVGEGRIHLCLVYLSGEIACAGIVTEMNGLCQYHLSATADAHLADHPSKLMLHHLRGWLKQRGNRIFHVGGGVGALRDPLYLFKAGFSPHSADFHTWRIIHDHPRYDRLLARWTELTGRSPVERETYFPQYRAS